MCKKTVAVIYGGRADEHSISCLSAASVLRSLDTAKFDAITIGITRDGEWLVDGDDPRGWMLGQETLPEIRRTPGSRRVILDPSQGSYGFFACSEDGTSIESLGKIDVVFPVLHGPYGEDGTIQGLFEIMGVPYVGCGVLASAACMDKHYTKELLSKAGIPVAHGFTLDTRDCAVCAGEYIYSRILQDKLEYPVFVKPSRAGSSFGVTRVDYTDDRLKLQQNLHEAVVAASNHDWRVIIEQGVDGREIECAVLRAKPGSTPQTAWPGEVVLDSAGDNDFYDFDSKYMDSQASHTEVPAHLPSEILEQVRHVAVKAFEAVDATGLSRVDTFVTPDGQVLVNEINTMPGFTSISMYAKAWEATGVSYTQLVTELIEGALS